MKIILYANRNVGLCALSYLVALGNEVKVITDGDKEIELMASALNCDILTFETDWDWELLLCVHGRKILSNEFISRGKAINIHPTDYIGHNPVRKVIANKDTYARIFARWMTDEVDCGDIVDRQGFFMEECKTYADFYNIAIPYYFKIIDRVLKIVS